MTVRRERLTRLILFAGILVMIALLAARFHSRLDLTARGDYTLTEYTRSVLEELKSPVQVTWYRTAILSRVSPDIKHVEDLLEEYRIASSGKFVWRAIDPASEPASAKPDALGIIPRQIETSSQGNTVVRTIYSGLVIEYDSASAVVPFVSESRHLEYDLTRMIVNLQSKETPRARIQLLYGTAQDQYKYVEPWLAYSGFDVVRVPPKDATLDSSHPLIVIGSSSLDEKTVDAIDSFLASGGSAAFFVAGTEILTTGNWSASAKYNDRLISLLASNGVRIEGNLVLDSSCFRMTLPALDNSRYETIDYPFWVTARPPVGTQKNALLAGIDSLQFYWPSRLSIAPGKEKNFESIASTSKNASIEDYPFDTNPFGRQIDSISKNSDGKPITIAVRSADDDHSRIVIVADELLPGAMNDYTGSDKNLDFLVNCAEWLSGRDRILSLKRTPTQPSASTISQDSLAYRVVIAISLVLIPIALLASIAFALANTRKKR